MAHGALQSDSESEGRQTLREALQFLSDGEPEGEDHGEVDRTMAHGALQSDSESEDGGFEHWSPPPRSVYESANTHVTASPSGRARSRSNGGSDEAVVSRRSSQASRRSAVQRSPPPQFPAPAAQVMAGPPRRSKRISERDAKRARGARGEEEDDEDDNNFSPAKKRGRPSGKGKGKSGK